MGLLPWHRLGERMRSALGYWLATTRPDGRPHAVPVWGVWLDDTFYFSNGANSRTGRNLARDPRVSVHLESSEDVVIIEGVAELVEDPALAAHVASAYAPKYLWYDPVEPWYALRAAVAFAWIAVNVGGTPESIYAGSATRYRFDD
jgi:PPOX class probable F420-dependent enzyme